MGGEGIVGGNGDAGAEVVSVVEEDGAAGDAVGGPVVDAAAGCGEGAGDVRGFGLLVWLVLVLFGGLGV